MYPGTVAECVMASAAAGAQHAVVRVLMDEGVLDTVSNQLANTWVRTGDYLLAASSFPPGNVVSNHPYVRLEEMKPSTALLCRKLYPTMIGRADLYIAFLSGLAVTCPQRRLRFYLC